MRRLPPRPRPVDAYLHLHINLVWPPSSSTFTSTRASTSAATCCASALRPPLIYVHFDVDLRANVNDLNAHLSLDLVPCCFAACRASPCRYSKRNGLGARPDRCFDAPSVPSREGLHRTAVLAPHKSLPHQEPLGQQAGQCQQASRWQQYFRHCSRCLEGLRSLVSWQQACVLTCRKCEIACTSTVWTSRALHYSGRPTSCSWR